MLLKSIPLRNALPSRQHAIKCIGQTIFEKTPLPSKVWECRINRELADNEDMKYYFDQYDGVDPLEPRDALYGGRTNVSRLYLECNDDEKIR